jgi:hypothetical protein
MALLLTACGGGGGGSVIPAFDLQEGVVATDLDGDGRIDVAVTNTYVAGAPPHPGTARVYLHSTAGARSFAAATIYDIGADPWDLVAADVNGDGRADLVASTPNSDQLWLLTQVASGAGRFDAARSLATLRAPYQLAAADLNADGRTDLAASVDNLAVGGVALLLQSVVTPGEFADATQVPIGPGGGAIAVGDLDGDGRNDVLAATSSADAAVGGVYLALQDPVLPGTFGLATKLDAGQKPAHVAVADLNGDQHPDLVVSNDAVDTRGSGITVLLADAAHPGEFLAGTKYAMDRIARMSCVADMNGDGLPDIVVAADVPGLTNDAETVVQIFLQDTTHPGRFVAAAEYRSGDLADSIAVADLDDDGLPDVVTAEGPQVLYNDPGHPGTLQALRAL